MFEYTSLVVYLMFVGLLSAVVFVLSYLLVYQLSDAEKVSAYECGFAPYGDARGKFEIRFYLVAILFIVFDLEITFLFPWTVTLSYIGMYGFISMFIFLFILTVGFCYEWIRGALDWHK